MQTFADVSKFKILPLSCKMFNSVYVVLGAWTIVPSMNRLDQSEPATFSIFQQQKNKKNNKNQITRKIETIAGPFG
jgi:hypothetical protein